MILQKMNLTDDDFTEDELDDFLISENIITKEQKGKEYSIAYHYCADINIGLKVAIPVEEYDRNKEYNDQCVCDNEKEEREI